MGKKTKRKKTPEQVVDEAIEVRENVISYTDYNTIMSIQLLIATLNRIEQRQIETQQQLSALREEVECINEYLAVPGDMKDGNKGQPIVGGEEKTEGSAGEDPTFGTDE